MEKKSQLTEVKKHLENYGTITQDQAREKYGATRLSAIVFILKDKGLNIKTEMIPHVNRYGNKGSYAKYILS